MESEEPTIFNLDRVAEKLDPSDREELYRLALCVHINGTRLGVYASRGQWNNYDAQNLAPYLSERMNEANRAAQSTQS